jgi:uncharacterized protein (TIGR00730 family)
MTSMSNTTSSRVRDPQVVQAIDALIQQVGTSPEDFRGQLMREMVQTCLRMGDEADTGEMKLFARSFKELRYAMKIFRPYRGTRKISIFGSARTPPGHPHYQAALQYSQLISAAGWMVITGAGDGIMRAGHGGAGRDASFGVAIRLPFETNANEFIEGDDKLVTFRYFFTRKLMFVSQADAVALFPGGFGTHDEGFEVLTLVQTGKTHMVPIVMVDAPGEHYWLEWDRYVKEHLLNTGMISPEDLNLYLVTDDTERAVQYVLNFYRNYHSQRYVRDTLVIRMHRPLSQPLLDEANEQFKDLIADGRMVQSGPIEGEGPDEFPDLPRLSFTYTKRKYGKLRLLLDHINKA